MFPAKRKATALEAAKSQTIASVRLEEMIAELMDYGRPSIFCSRELTWSCYVELNTDQIIDGAKVRSGFGHPTINSAVGAVLEHCRTLHTGNRSE